MLIGAGCAGASSQSEVAEYDSDISIGDEVSNEDNAVTDSESDEVSDEPPVGAAKFTYVDYSPEELERHQARGATLLFFHAAWCPTCRSADTDISKNGNAFPPELAILKVNYDKERDLKRRYNVTTQHTFVQIDSEGNEIKKWIGGGVALINQQIEL